jgi:hypothetical protein
MVRNGLILFANARRLMVITRYCLWQCSIDSHPQVVFDLQEQHGVSYRSLMDRADVSPFAA